MSQKTLNRLLMALGALVALWMVTLLATRTENGAGGDGGVAALLEDVDTEALTAMTFSGGTGDLGAVRLTRTDTGWTVDGHRADSLQTARLLEALDGALAGAPVASNPMNHARMEVDDSSARMLVLEQEDRVDTLLLGKVGTSYSSIYARLPGRDDVYLIDTDLQPHATRELPAWRSRRISAIDTAAVSDIELVVANDEILLQRGDTAWTVQNSAADAQAVQDLLSEVRALDATGFPPADSADSVTEGTPERVVTVLDDAGTELLVVRLWGAEDGSSTNMTGRAEGPAARQPGVAFTVPQWRADRLAPSATQLSGNVPPP